MWSTLVRICNDNGSTLIISSKPCISVPTKTRRTSAFLSVCAATQSRLSWIRDDFLRDYPQGDEVMVLLRVKPAKSKRLSRLTGIGKLTLLSVTLTLEDEIDCLRDMIARPGTFQNSVKKLDAMIVWMSEEAMVENSTCLSRPPKL